MSSNTMPNSAPDDDSEPVQWSSAQLGYAIGHVFLPVHHGYTLPEHPVENNASFARAVCATAHAYSKVIDDALGPQWCRITRMLDFLQNFIQPGCLTNNLVVSQLRGMQTGDTLVLLNRTQDAAVIFTKQDHCALYEIFRSSNCIFKGLYRECAIEIPDEVFLDHCFQSELADFLLQLDGFPVHKIFSEDITTRPIELLTSILRGVGRSTEIPIVISRTNSYYKLQFWSRSLLWFLIKFVIQTSVVVCDLGSICYKAFLLRFMCNLAKNAVDAKLSSHLLHAISVKILRRLRKLGSSCPDWLHTIVVETSTSLRDTLDARWKEIQAAQQPSAMWEPSLLDIDGDTQLSLVQSRDYIRTSLTDLESKSPDPPFCPKHLLRGTLSDFLSSNGSFFEEAYRVEPYVALYDVEQAVEQGIDKWVACVTNVEQTCVQIAMLMNMYLSNAQSKYNGSPENLSIMVLTGIEFWVALDKLVVGAFPTLATYSLQFPIKLLDRLHFREATNLYRLCRVYQHISTLQSRSVSGQPVLEGLIQKVFPNRDPTAIQSELKSRTSWDHVAERSEMPLPVAVWYLCPYLLPFQGGTFNDDFTHRLLSSPSLDQYIEATSHASNAVLAAQMQCPNGLSIHEFVAFGHLRSGGSLQWVNILRELRSRTLNFRSQDVYLLLTQAASQVGPLDLNTAGWVWHQELQDSLFCYTLLDELESLFVDVVAHSFNGVMMGILSLFLTRLLGSNPCEDVEERAIGLLLRIRRQAFHWVQELSQDVIMAPTKTERSDLLRDLAATCRSTFNVELKTVHKVLRSAEDIDALLFCAILVHVNSPIDTKSMPRYSRLLLEQDCRLSLALESVLRDVILVDASSRGVDLAVRRVWPGYHPGPCGWQALSSPKSRWLACETAVGETGCSQMVHLNLLDGTLLVDGKSIAGLPDEIREQPTYKRIFGDQHFIAIASDLPGMDFCCLTMVFDHQVHFALQSGDLVIRAQHRDATDILQVIPWEKLQGDLPTSFVNGHVHWLNLSTSIIEIRPLERIWEQSSDDWRIDCSSGKYRMYNGREKPVDIRSPTYKMVSGCLQCLDAPENLIITTLPINIPQSSLTQRLSVVLPRYGLSFFVNEDGELESRDFKTMVYDENQCIGTLFGLENRLVLRRKVQVQEELIHKCIIIPEGKISPARHNHHVRARIFPDALPPRPVTYHAYHVDPGLVCLTSHASWRSKLYLACLHAETSIDWMPDPLTGRTGVQEALCLLRSAGCRSIMELDVRHEENKHPLSVDEEMYPQIQFALKEIEYLIERQRFLLNHRSDPPSRPDLDVIGALRTAYLFPFEVVNSVPPPPPIHVDPPKFKSSESGDLSRTISLAVYHWLIKAQAGVESGNTGLARTPLKAPAWANSDLVPPSVTEAEDLLQEAMDTHQQQRLLFLLPSIIYDRRDPEAHFLSILVALAKRFPLDSPPCHAQCRPLYGYRPSKDALRKCFSGVRMHEYDLNHAVNKLLVAWPIKTATVVSPSYRPRLVEKLNALFSPVISEDIYLDTNANVATMERLNTKLRTLISECYRNLELKEDLLRRLTKLETEHHSLPNTLLPPTLRLWPNLSNEAPDSPIKPHLQVTLTKLLRDRSPPNIPPLTPLQCYSPENNGLASIPDTHAFNRLFDSLRIAKTAAPFQQQYISRLLASAQYAHAAPGMSCGTTGKPSIEELQKHYAHCRDNYVASLTILMKRLGPQDIPLEQVLHRSGQWPQITPNALLRCLASTSPIKLPDGWKKYLVLLALLLLELQRSWRLHQLALDDLADELSIELDNRGCSGWRAEDRPDWLLIQLQGNFLIRGFQADVAKRIISPAYSANSVAQVNMGEGKSSVILPISAATLADGNQLVRVIVPKALTVQTFQLLLHRLGGLVNRPIYHLPLSRSLIHGYCDQIELLRELFSECMRNCGILVVQPEHVLSLKLTTVEQQLPLELRGKNANANERSRFSFLELQRWLHSCARDIMDESDKVLHPRFQLMFTIGPQQDMEGYPDRWTVTQHVLRLARNHIIFLAHTRPNAIEYERGPSGSFPRIHILQTSDTYECLISLIVGDVMSGRLPGFTLRDTDRHPNLRDLVRVFISSKEVSKEMASMVEEYARKTGLWDGLLLLRGLLACGILWVALTERRWRVDYGLSPNRTMLAVPYRAKDVPAQAAEFGHPDITIMLTCLSYYYGGLTEEQLRASFKLLQEQYNPSMEYSNWLRDHELHSVPKPIQDFRSINIQSSEQWEKYLFPLFARNQAAVDFYLSQVVFPKEAKEFPWKLSVSSWDLAENRECPITGFSGTNDNQYLLPSSIAQRDPDHQLGSNARVLSHLLQSENNFYMLISDMNGQRQTTLELLKIVVDQEPKIRVFLDVGAQILDLSNDEVAKAWLNLDAGSDKAIYFNEDDELMVLTKDGTKRSLASSPFAQQLDHCVVYLDDAHTRGTDLKLPTGSRAAVTLGPKVTKDRLVQGCMRMRKLGYGHSVMFFAPHEVDRNIRSLAEKEDQDIPVTTTDILRWTIHETWADIQHQAPYWAQQGINHGSQYEAWSRFCTTSEQLPFSRSNVARRNLADAWLQPELKSLANLYAPFQYKNTTHCSPILDGHPDIQQRCIELGAAKPSEAQMEEEREREVDREIEREREAERRSSDAEPASHSLHPDVAVFIRTGFLPLLRASSAFRPVFTTLEGSTMATTNASVWSPFILATTDFLRTIKPAPHNGEMDQSPRPVQWIISGKGHYDRVLILLSPFEVGRLMPEIRDSRYIHLHAYTPRTSESMRPVDDLMFYSIPPVPNTWRPPWDLIDQLNVFAGQLYLRDYDSYLRLCRLLGIQNLDLAQKIGTTVGRELTTPGALEENRNMFADSPLSSLRKLLVIRRSGLSFGETHMGRILQGQQLTKEDFENVAWATPEHNSSTRDTQMLHDVASAPTVQDGSASSTLIRSSHQGRLISRVVFSSCAFVCIYLCYFH